MVIRPRQTALPHYDGLKTGRPQTSIDLIKEENDEVPLFDLTGLDDDDDSIEVIREVTPLSRHAVSTTRIRQLDTYRTSQREAIRPGTVVELYDGDFLKVVFIQQDASTGAICLKGHLLRRNKYVYDMLPKKTNELCMMLQAPLQQNPGLEDCMIDVPASKVKRTRLVFFTNQPFPALSFRENLMDDYRDWEDIHDRAQLVCRWKHTETLDASCSKVLSMSLQPLKEAECDTRFCSPEPWLLRKFLGSRAPSEARQELHTPSAATPTLIDTGKRHTPAPRPVKQRTTPSPSSSSSISSGKRSFSEVINLDSDVEDGNLVIVECATKKLKRLSIRPEHEKRGEKPKIGSYFTAAKATTSQSDGSHSSLPPRTAQRSYTFGDLCTGAGGMASGAQQAGVRINFLLDHWEDACRTLDLNFQTKVVRKDIYAFCTQRSYSWEKVDVLHISFPCQPHSPAHTKPGQNDDKNIATAYSVAPILQRCKPRIVTFEQTSGIVTHNGGQHYRALIRQIIDQGYSVRAQICNLLEYGNYQPRKRLIIIAACPGEILPTFPEATHGPGRQPYPTVADALRKVQGHRVPDHMRYAYPKNAESYDPRTPLRSAITCSGGAGNLHPSGRRTFNLQELAVLQGFPLTHRFFGNTSSIKTQIGNAVPSVFAKTLYQHIIKSLEASDRKLAAYKPPVIDLD